MSLLPVLLIGCASKTEYQASNDHDTTVALALDSPRRGVENDEIVVDWIGNFELIAHATDDDGLKRVTISSRNSTVTCTGRFGYATNVSGEFSASGEEVDVPTIGDDVETVRETRITISPPDVVTSSCEDIEEDGCKWERQITAVAYPYDGDAVVQELTITSREDPNTPC